MKGLLAELFCAAVRQWSCSFEGWFCGTDGTDLEKRLHMLLDLELPDA